MHGQHGFTNLFTGFKCVALHVSDDCDLLFFLFLFLFKAMGSHKYLEAPAVEEEVAEVVAVEVEVVVHKSLLQMMP